MEFSIFIPLMVAAIQSAGQILSSVVSRVKDVANKHIFDKTFVENVVLDSNNQLADLLKATAIDLKEEMREQSITDVVQEVQADIIVLGKLLDLASASEISPAIAEHLMLSALFPLQRDLEKAEIRLQQFGKEDMGLYLHIVGAKTLIAGYALLGQDMPTLQKDLEDSSCRFQKRLLDAVAKMMIKADIEIPWEKVSFLISVEGITDLYDLYKLTSQTAKNNEMIDQAGLPDDVTQLAAFEMHQKKKPLR